MQMSCKTHPFNVKAIFVLHERPEKKLILCGLISARSAKVAESLKFQEIRHVS